MSTDDEPFKDLVDELTKHLDRTPTTGEINLLLFGSEEEVLKLLGRANNA